MVDKDSECPHCDHYQGRIVTSGGTTTNYVCCHCGRHRSEFTPPLDPHKWERKIAEPGHGPFVPVQTVEF